MIAAITGGTGFIGRKLVLHCLSQGHEVRVLSRSRPDNALSKLPVQWFQGDLENGRLMQAFFSGADVLYHCAAEIRDPAKMKTVNVDGTRKLIESASGAVARWVQLSSVGAYGKIREGLVTEETVTNPLGNYETSKLESDKLVQEASAKGAFEHVILRPSNVYGSEMRNQSLFRLIAMINRGWFFFIGKPGASANYLHVDNVIDALSLCATHSNARGHVFNLSDHRTIENFVSEVARELGHSCPRLRLPEMPIRKILQVTSKLSSRMISESAVDALTSRAEYPVNKICRELGYRHSVSMEQGLQSLVQHWKSQYE